MTKQKKIVKDFAVTVDYSQSVKQAVESGNYSYVNSNIASTNFPDAQSKQGVEAGKQKSKVTTQVTLISLDRKVTTEQALKKIDQQGYRPANLYELLALGAQHQEIQLTNLVVGLGSSWADPWGDRNVPYLGRDGSDRYLYLHWTAYGWGDGWRFAAVRKPLVLKSSKPSSETLVPLSKVQPLIRAVKNIEWMVSELQMFKNRPEFDRALIQCKKALEEFE